MSSDPETGDFTRVLRQTDASDTGLVDRLFPLVYEDLKRVALARLADGHGDATLDATALVHEVYAKFAKRPQAWADRGHFFAVAATAMRQILVDHLRRKRRVKRGGDRVRITLDPARLRVEEQAEVLLDLDEALVRLEEVDSRLARVVEFRFFSGLNEDESASALGVTARTVRRDWVKAKSLLALFLDAELSTP